MSEQKHLIRSNNMIPIRSITAEAIRDSRNKPTLLVRVVAGDAEGTFAVPSGASTGAHEALELRDADGAGVSNAIQNVNEIIAPKLIGMDANDQRTIDDALIALDGTPNKTKLGGNAIIGVSIAVAKAAAKAKGIAVFEHLRMLAPEITPSRKMPYLFMNLVNGGLHAHTKLSFQEYHVVPETDDVAEAFAMGAAIQNSLTEIADQKYGNMPMGDEGGLALDVESVREPLVLLTEAVAKAGYAGRVHFALDVAASSLYENGLYTVSGKKINADELAHIYSDFIQEFDVFSIEDPFAEESFADFSKLLTDHTGLHVVGDDLTVTNIERLKIAVTQKSVNALIIKPNQIGTLIETLNTMAYARAHNIDCIVSHRSGETMDDFIADLAYAFGCFGLKAGAPQKAERAVKYERLIAISK